MFVDYPKSGRHFYLQRKKGFDNLLLGQGSVLWRELRIDQCVI